jgi:hypothetical protein
MDKQGNHEPDCKRISALEDMFSEILGQRVTFVDVTPKKKSCKRKSSINNVLKS